MNVFSDPDDFGPPGAVVAIGMFDGVHRGHRRVLGRLRELGLQHGLPTVVLTFDPHPRAVLNPESAPKLLSSLADRMDLLSATGSVDHCLTLPFDRRRSQESVDDFVRGILVKRLGMRALVVGENFACGRGRRGNVDELRRLGAEFEFDVHAIRLRATSDPAGLPHCSSTETRRLIQQGDVRSASMLLGRPHELIGSVAAMAGTPTHSGRADLPREMCIPPAGDYFGCIRPERSDSSWIPATFQVSEAPLTHLRSVSFVAEGALPAAAGDLVSMQFLASANA